MDVSSAALFPKTTGKVVLSPLAQTIGDVGSPVVTRYDIPSTHNASRLCDSLEGKNNCEVGGLDWRTVAGEAPMSIPATTGVDEMTPWPTTVASINDEQRDLQLAFKRPRAGDKGVCREEDSEMALMANDENVMMARKVDGNDQSELMQGAHPQPLQETNSFTPAGFVAHVGNHRASPFWQRLRGMLKDQQELSHSAGTESGVQGNKTDGKQDFQCCILEGIAPKGGHSDGNDGQDCTETTCVKSWRQRENDEAKAKEEAKLAQAKRAERVREVRNRNSLKLRPKLAAVKGLYYRFAFMLRGKNAA